MKAELLDYLRDPKCPRWTLKVLTIISHLESREVVLEPWLLVWMRTTREDLEGKILKEMVGRVRYSQDSDEDFGKGRPIGS